MSKLLISTAVLAASIGSCGTQRLPPSSTATTTTEESTEGDRWAGLPEECRELAEPCEDCDQVERMRRDILAKKCVPVCDAYLEESSRITSSLPDEGVTLLESDALCGKEGAKCSLLEEAMCSHSISYVGAGSAFRQFWASPEDAPPGEELIRRFHAEFLVEYLDAHQGALDWASANAQDATPVLTAGGKLMDMTSREVIEGFRAEVSTEIEATGDETLSKKYDAIVALIELVRTPADLGTWSRRRADLETVALAE
jgi:hypothetical protein